MPNVVSYMHSEIWDAIHKLRYDLASTQNSREMIDLIHSFLSIYMELSIIQQMRVLECISVTFDDMVSHQPVPANKWDDIRNQTDTWHVAWHQIFNTGWPLRYFGKDPSLKSASIICK